MLEKVKMMKDKVLTELLDEEDFPLRFLTKFESMSSYDPMYKVIMRNRLGGASEGLGNCMG